LGTFSGVFQPNFSSVKHLNQLTTIKKS